MAGVKFDRVAIIESMVEKAEKSARVVDREFARDDEKLSRITQLNGAMQQHDELSLVARSIKLRAAS